MTRETLMRLNKNALVETIIRLEKENRLLKEKIVYQCMDCNKDFEYEQVTVEDADGNILCPYCGSGDIEGGIKND